MAIGYDLAFGLGMELGSIGLAALRWTYILLVFAERLKIAQKILERLQYSED